MKIRKIGHCCLLIQTKKLTILTDPGNFSVEQNSILGIDVILITHEHADHLHTESLEKIIKNNPEAKIFTNSGVGIQLDKLGITYTLLEGSDTTYVNECLLEACDSKHEEIFEELGQVQNTGYFIDNKLFYPGDSFANPEKEIDVLALPVAGPWCTVSEAIHYALHLKPKVVFPVHDGMLQADRIGAYHRIPEKVLGENGIRFVAMIEGDEQEF